MNEITQQFGTLYHPVKAFVVYQNQQEQQVYVEAYDMDGLGCPINAHPLTIRESAALAKALDCNEDLKRGFLKPSGLLPENVLYIDSGTKGFALWHTPAMQVNLLFKENLTIPCGKTSVPPLLWVASKETLHIYALPTEEPLSVHTPLSHAPFFNIYRDGRVCMGNVPIRIPSECGLEEFMRLWEGYFWNSYFSHLLEGHQPVKGNIVQLWQSLVGTGRKFPKKSLIKNGLTVKNLLQ